MNVFFTPLVTVYEVGRHSYSLRDEWFQTSMGLAADVASHEVVIFQGGFS